MNDIDATIDRAGARPPRQWTGRTVLGCLLGFFGVVFAANAILVHEALSTFGGLETESSYRAGRMFAHEAAMAKAQDARQWHVDAKVTPSTDGVRLDIDARDAASRPLTGMEVTATFERPTDRRLDRNFAIAETAPGRFRGSVEIPAGQWDLVIELARNGERQFRSKNRIDLR